MSNKINYPAFDESEMLGKMKENAANRDRAIREGLAYASPVGQKNGIVPPKLTWEGADEKQVTTLADVKAEKAKDAAALEAQVLAKVSLPQVVEQPSAIQPEAEASPQEPLHSVSA